jgi:hypothetical protein
MSKRAIFALSAAIVLSTAATASAAPKHQKIAVHRSGPHAQAILPRTALFNPYSPASHRRGGSVNHTKLPCHSPRGVPVGGKQDNGRTRKNVFALKATVFRPLVGRSFMIASGRKLTVALPGALQLAAAIGNFRHGAILVSSGRSPGQEPYITRSSYPAPRIPQACPSDGTPEVVCMRHPAAHTARRSDALRSLNGADQGSECRQPNKRLCSADASACVLPRGNLVGTFRGPCTFLTRSAHPEGVAFALRRPDHCSVGDGCGGKCVAGAIDRDSVSRESSYMPAGCQRRAADSGRGQF